VVAFSKYLPGLDGLDEVLPAQLVGLGAAVLGMLVGSLGPQWIGNRCLLNLDEIGNLESSHPHEYHHQGYRPHGESDSK